MDKALGYFILSMAWRHLLDAECVDVQAMDVIETVQNSLIEELVAEDGHYSLRTAQIVIDWIRFRALPSHALVEVANG